MANPLEQIATKTVGTAHAMKAGFNGLRGVFLHLAEEHGEVISLMKRVAKSADEHVRREHYPLIRSELLSHERGELAAVYSVLLRRDETGPLALSHNQQAQQLEAAIAELDAIAFASPAWGETFDRILSDVVRHIDQEENDFFPRAQETVDEARSKELLQHYETAKESVKRQLSATNHT